ncbi:hypothetical protein [Xenorhabdus vietnamensis]|uniref:hypothetical protein n=1 Tax=Xenorhabdus vietnamensis TaxID=351656 RepID=UPI00142E5893|nr:hypothetical protein [Xenorhabdus vietnamensis]
MLPPRSHRVPNAHGLVAFFISEFRAVGELNFKPSAISDNRTYLRRVIAVCRY